MSGGHKEAGEAGEAAVSGCGEEKKETALHLVDQEGLPGEAAFRQKLQQSESKEEACVLEAEGTKRQVAG